MHTLDSEQASQRYLQDGVWLYFYIFFFPPFQIVKLMKSIVSAASQVLGNNNVDEGECHYWKQDKHFLVAC